MTSPEPFQELANAIVIQTAKDWRRAVRTLRKHPEKSTARLVRDDCERFFRSEWIGILTEVDGRYILHRLKEEEHIHDE